MCLTLLSGSFHDPSILFVCCTSITLLPLLHRALVILLIIGKGWNEVGSSRSFISDCKKKQPLNLFDPLHYVLFDLSIRNLSL
jgi:hypothetical protein